MLKLHLAIAVALAGFGFLLGILSLFGFIFGLVYKRKGLWITSLVTFMIAGPMVLFAVTWAVFTAVQPIVERVIEPLTAVAVPTISRDTAGSDATMRKWFSAGTDIELPDEAEYLVGKDFGGPTCVIYMKLRVPADFQSQLDAHLRRTTPMPDELNPRYGYGIVEEMPFWQAEVTTPALVYYESHITREAENCGSWDAALAFDENTGTIWFVTDECARDSD